MKIQSPTIDTQKALLRKNATFRVHNKRNLYYKDIELGFITSISYMSELQPGQHIFYSIMTIRSKLEYNYLIYKLFREGHILEYEHEPIIIENKQEPSIFFKIINNDDGKIVYV